jgi:hypothetical protein
MISQLEDTCKTIEVSQVTPSESMPNLQFLGVCGFLGATLEIPILMFHSFHIKSPPS